MNPKVSFFVASLLLLLGCESHQSPKSEEPKIYRALLVDLGAEKAESLTVRAESISGKLVIEGFDQLKIEASEMKQSFIHMNSEPSLVPLSRITFGHIAIVSNRELEEIFHTKSYEQNWKKYYSKFPKSTGIIGLSRVGFNSEADKAVVYIENKCGKLCGNGYIVYLERGLLGWKVKRTVHLWIS